MFTIILTVILIMPKGVEDITQSRDMPTMQECMAAANDWLSQDVEKSGGKGLGAGCSISPTDGMNG